MVGKDLRVRYRQDLAEIIHGMSFTIPAGSKVGVVGRTGSGKSSLIQAMFRLNEISGGTLEVDGSNIMAVSLPALRSSMSLIPQEPELFSGSCRYNLDPFGAQTDATILEVLRAIQLDGVVTSLDMEVEEGGSNFSGGQRQLLSLARAMLRRSQIVIVDEATANVDYDTDALVQRTLKSSEYFKGSTVIMIAHRIATVQDSDLILVLDDGHLVEQGTPDELIARGGKFADMVVQTQTNEG